MSHPMPKERSIRVFYHATAPSQKPLAAQLVADGHGDLRHLRFVEQDAEAWTTSEHDVPGAQTCNHKAPNEISLQKPEATEQREER